MEPFSSSWAALRTAVAELPDDDFARPSGCAGRLVRDLVCHRVIDAQHVLITLVTSAGPEPTRNALTYWDVTGTPPTGDDPLDALLPLLRASEHGRIVNVSSTVGSLSGMMTSPSPISLAYVPSKTALNAVTVLYAKAEPGLKVNSACPGYCATDLNNHSGHRTPAEGARTAVRLATLDDDGPTGGFFDDEWTIAW